MTIMTNWNVAQMRTLHIQIENDLQTLNGGKLGSLFFLPIRIDSSGPTIANSIGLYFISGYRSVSPKKKLMIASIAQTINWRA